VTDSHHWLKVVEFFPSNFAGFSIFNLEVVILASFAGCFRVHAAVIPAPTSLAVSAGVSMVANCPSVGRFVSGGGFPVGRFRSYRSSSSVSSPLGGGEGDGDTAGLHGLQGGPPPPPVPPADLSEVHSPGMALSVFAGSVVALEKRGVIGGRPVGCVGTSFVGVWGSGMTMATFQISS